MIEELAKNDSLWRSYALKICNNKDLADDLVGDMYIKLHNSTKELNRSYVYRTLKTLFLDEVKRLNKENKVSIESLYYLESEEITKDKHLQQCLDQLKWFDKEILLLTHNGHSLRVNEKLSGVYYGVLNYHKNKALEKLKILYNGKK